MRGQKKLSKQCRKYSRILFDWEKWIFYGSFHGWNCRLFIFLNVSLAVVTVTLHFPCGQLISDHIQHFNLFLSQINFLKLAYWTIGFHSPKLKSIIRNAQILLYFFLASCTECIYNQKYNYHQQKYLWLILCQLQCSKRIIGWITIHRTGTYIIRKCLKSTNDRIKKKDNKHQGLDGASIVHLLTLVFKLKINEFQN